jgi:hydroxymethylpyrimidine pyrophosphatase-like HAD family hydrolase
VAQTGDVACCVVTPDAFLSTQPDISLPRHHQHWNIETAVVENFERTAAEGNVLQMIVVGSYYGVNTILKYTEDKMRREELKLRMYESYSRTDRWFLEIRSSKATKYNALVRLLREYPFGLDQVIGIGDNYNDLDFCRKAGYVVAVKNAVEDLREIADFVTRLTCDNAGIDEFFRHFLEIRGVDRNEIDNVVGMEQARRKRSR